MNTDSQGNAGVPAPTLVYLLGHNYSGSTLLAMLLAAHPSIGTTGEIVGPPHLESGRPFLCSCGRPIQDCTFYRELQTRIGHPNFDLDALRWRTRICPLRPTFRERLWFGPLRYAPVEGVREWVRPASRRAMSVVRATTDLNARFVEAALALTGASILVDSSKTPSQLTVLSGIPDVRLKIVHLLRHPCGCVVSAAKHNRLPYHVAAGIWRRNFQACRRGIERLGDHHHIQVRYEDLCASPRETLAGIADFVGVPFDERMLQYRTDGHHIVGNEMRLRHDASITLDERWRRTLSKAEVSLIRDITRGEAESAGYTYE